MKYLSPSYKIISENNSELIFAPYYTKSLSGYLMFFVYTPFFISFTTSLNDIFLIVVMISIILLMVFLIFKYNKWIIKTNEPYIVIESYIFGKKYFSQEIIKKNIMGFNFRKHSNILSGYWYLYSHSLYICTNEKEYKIFHHRDKEVLYILKQKMYKHISP